MTSHMNSDLNKVIAELFSDSKNIQILCSIYENEVSAEAVANLLEMNESEVVERLEMLRKESLVSRRQEGDGVIYSLVNPRVCDSILLLRDSLDHR